MASHALAPHKTGTNAAHIETNRFWQIYELQWPSNPNPASHTITAIAYRSAKSVGADPASGRRAPSQLKIGL